MSAESPREQEPGRNRQRRKDPPRQPPLRGERLHQPAQVGALAKRLDHGVEDLGGVATGRPLQLGQERDLLEVAVRHAGGNPTDRLFDGTPNCSSVSTR